MRAIDETWTAFGGILSQKQFSSEPELAAAYSVNNGAEASGEIHFYLHENRSSTPPECSLFKSLSESSETYHTVLLFDADVQWLSRGGALTRLSELLEEVEVLSRDQTTFYEDEHA